MNPVKVALGERSYPIHIGRGMRARLGELIHAHRIRGVACVVTQKEIWSRWSGEFTGALERESIPFKVHMPAPFLKSEKMKSAQELLKVVSSCAALDGKGKSVYLIAFGGGVVGDVTGFAAAVYRRGIPYVQVPTTLTAQVDSAIGAKTAVDPPQGKNLLGVIYQPRFVLADPEFLRTLSPEMYRDGLGEVVKYALIRDPKLLKELEDRKQTVLDRDPVLLTKVIAACAAIKAKVVSGDEFDKKGVRAVLNFGHTFGHAIEAATRYGLYTHGEAVSIGMMCALELSASLSVLKDLSLIPRTERLLSAFGLPVRLDRRVGVQAVMRAMGFDKKSVDGKNRFVLLEKAGKTELREEISWALVGDHVTRRREGYKPRANLFGFLSKKSAGRSAAARVATPPPSQDGSPVGEVEGFFKKANAAVIRITSGSLRLNDRIWIRGHSTDLKCTIESMQIDRKPISAAEKGQVIGLQVEKRCRNGDKVYLIS